MTTSNASKSKNTIIDAKQAIFDKIFKENQELREQNHELNLVLENFERLARKREEQLNHFESLEERLLNTNDLASLLTATQKILATDFNIPIASITLIEGDMGKESDTTLDSLLETVAETQKLSPTPVLSLISVENYKRLFPAQKPLVTLQPDPVLINLFATTTEIASAAFIPLLSRSRSIGILNLASPDAEKFVPGTATDAVEKLGRILATVIENNLLETRLLQLLESNPE